ncbi:hypothetical protein MYCTH_2070700 [Thermothelomyces thermophilus ATCC 42464]|uniref:Uncharacterized protein n=1 Tax=Thermothelomyces thermophilus (strain ATCC 42464 / BCRC 31852 / DSM 1799) TaxID=573729 RepID=G2QPM0_THET4|nr:uncharacterized protein MYCTH_2070700 [Thermothelomyces thermophilus ATCC 42464]AEO61533.1 hypothetical protein MYCTH_2070700 [Thermothelomyces thermophilus ATCC 42464]
MLILAGPLCLFIIPLLFQKWRAWRLDEWVHEQLRVADFRYAGNIRLEERLRLRATENRRLRAAFGIDNSLTTTSPSDHRAFLKRASWLLKRGDRSWEQLYRTAEDFLGAEVRAAVKEGRYGLHLAESVRCMVLAVVLFDNFGIEPASIPRAHLVTITREINEQWLRSKRDPVGVAPSSLLYSTIESLNVMSPFANTESVVLSAPEVLSLLMPQYETLWRVVLLTFVTAYHHQPDAYPDAVQRTADVPACLGHPAKEKEALKLAKEGLRLYPSNKHLYRAAPSCLANPEGSTNRRGPARAADISALHRHPSIWGGGAGGGGGALAFRPARFDDGALTDLQRRAYAPFSRPPHRCPAAGSSSSSSSTAAEAGKNSFGERMIVVLVVALGRALGRDKGRVVLGEEKGGEGGPLPTGRDEMEGWVWVWY